MEENFHTKIFHAIKASSPHQEIQNLYWKNMILTGGTSLLKGFHGRLTEELKDIQK